MSATGTATAVVMLTDGTVTIGPLGTDLASIQAVIGGYIEIVSIGDGVHAYVDEEGKMKGRDLNGLASGTIRDLFRRHGERFGDWIVGPAVFLGDGPDGQEGDVPKWFVDYVTEWVLDTDDDDDEGGDV